MNTLIYAEASDVTSQLTVITTGVFTGEGDGSPPSELFVNTILHSKEIYFVHSYSNVHRILRRGAYAYNNLNIIIYFVFTVLLSNYNSRQFGGGGSMRKSEPVTSG